MLQSAAGSLREVSRSAINKCYLYECKCELLYYVFSLPCPLFVLVPPSIRRGAHRGIHLEPGVGATGSNGDEVSLVLLLSCYFVSLSLSFFSAPVWFIMCFGVVIWPPHPTSPCHCAVTLQPMEGWRLGGARRDGWRWWWWGYSHWSKGLCMCVYREVKLSWGRRACSVQLEEAEMSGGVKLALHRPPPTAPPPTHPPSISTYRPPACPLCAVPPRKGSCT